MFKKFLIFLVIFSAGAGFGHSYLVKNQSLTSFGKIAEKNTNKAFLYETYDKIKGNYWDPQMSDAKLVDLFKRATEKITGKSLEPDLATEDKLISSILKNVEDGQKQTIIPQIVGTVLASLPPAGRSSLYTQKMEQQLNNTVNNVNPQKDLYKDLGLSKGASTSAVADAFQKQSDELKKQNTPQAKEKLKEISYAKDVLTKQDSKLRYDSAQVEPTIFTKIAGPGILYLQFKKFSPTSLDEFQKAFDAYKEDLSLNALILDLRGNVGGAIDETAYFLGYFLGKGQNAFDFYHKGEYTPFRTPTDKLTEVSRYKQMVILIDQNTQSSAEMMAASLKKYHVGVLLGITTKGWGTVEKVFPLDNQIDPTQKYSIFLVHSITLRDDNQPIEGRGVEPDINIKDSNWEDQLFSYFRNQNIINAVKSLI